MSALLTVFLLFVFAIALEKEVMRKVRKFRFQQTLTEEDSITFKDSNTRDSGPDKKQEAPATLRFPSVVYVSARSNSDGAGARFSPNDVRA